MLTQFYYSSTNTFITCSLYTVRRCHTSPGAPDLRARLGCLQGSTRNGMWWGALALLEISHSRGCYLKCTVLPVHEGVLTKMTKYQRTKEPRDLCPGGLYSWWHFASPANGSGSHDCAPVTWAYGIPCPAMVSPNAGPGKEDKLLHPDDHLIWRSKVDSGPRTLKSLQTKQLNCLSQ